MSVLTFQPISLENKEAVAACAALVTRYSWGEDYPASANDEIIKGEFYIGAFDGDRLIGLAGINRHSSPDGIGNGELWFANAVIEPGYRGNKVYSTLYEKRMDYLPAKVTVFICTDNPIIDHFMLQRGWVFLRETLDEAGDVTRVYKLTLKADTDELYEMP